MNKKSYIFCFVMFTILFIGIYLAGINYGRTGLGEIATTVQDIDVGAVVETTEQHMNSRVEVEGYWIKAVDGYIVIYNTDGSVVANTEIATQNFTESEQNILKNGIYVETAEDLFKYLESYTS